MIWCLLLILPQVLSVRVRVKDNAVDLSDKQENANLYVAAINGIDIVIHKATEGSEVEDEQYEERYPTAKAAGVKFWGAYHLADNSDGMVQAARFLSLAREADFYALYLDFIGNKTVSLKEAEAFVITIIGLTERKPFIVGSSNFLDKLGNSSTIASCPLWVVDWWASEPTVPRMWKDKGWVIWQHTNGEVGFPPFTAPGIGNCHRDVVNMTRFLKIINSYSDYQLVYKMIAINKRHVEYAHEEEFRFIPPSTYAEVSLLRRNEASKHEEETIIEPGSVNTVGASHQQNVTASQDETSFVSTPPKGVKASPPTQNVKTIRPPVPISNVDASLKQNFSLPKIEETSQEGVKTGNALMPLNNVTTSLKRNANLPKKRVTSKHKLKTTLAPMTISNVKDSQQGEKSPVPFEDVVANLSKQQVAIKKDSKTKTEPIPTNSVDISPLEQNSTSKQSKKTKYAPMVLKNVNFSLKRDVKKGSKTRCKNSINPKCKNSIKLRCKNRNKARCKNSIKARCKNRNKARCKNSIKAQCKNRNKSRCKNSIKARCKNRNKARCKNRIKARCKNNTCNNTHQPFGRQPLRAKAVSKKDEKEDNAPVLLRNVSASLSLAGENSL